MKNNFMEILQFMGDNWVFFIGMGLILGGVFAELIYLINKLTQRKECIASLKIYTNLSQDISTMDVILNNIQTVPTNAFGIDVAVGNLNTMNNVQTFIFFITIVLQQANKIFPSVPQEIWIEEATKMIEAFEKDSAKAYLSLFRSNNRIAQYLNAEELEQAKGLIERVIEKHDKKYSEKK